VVTHASDAFACLFAEGVRSKCTGDGLAYLESVCMKMPEERCLSEGPGADDVCGEDEFHCGDGQCIDGLKVCDYGYDCHNGADELRW